MLVKSVTELIGNTPLMELVNYNKSNALRATVYAKLEYLNPAGSVKDRVGLAMLEDAERSGRLVAGGAVVEPTSGNTGIGIAAVAAAKGYRAIFTMPDTMSVERRAMLKAYGAEVVLTEGSLGMAGAIAKAEEIAATQGAVYMGQFINTANPKKHFETTGPEIYRDLDGEIDILVATVGSGGTITGTAEYLKEKIPSLEVVAVEPAGSPVLSGGKAGAHKIQGIGAGFVPAVCRTELFDEVITVADEAAFAASKAFGRTEGVLVGISSGAALWAATELAKRPTNEGKNIVVVLPDSADRYLSTPLFE